MNKAESQTSLLRCLDQPNADTPDGASSAAACFEGMSVSNKHLSEPLVATPGIDQEATPESSLMTRITRKLFESSQEQEDATLAQLEAIMTEDAFKDFQRERERGKKTSKGYPATYFGMWYNRNKTNPDLQQILTEQKDTDAVKALKSQIVQYEMGALEQLKSLENPHLLASLKESIPTCLKLKAEDLFDKHNNYLRPNPKLEVKGDEIEEVLGWYCQGVEEREVWDQYYVSCDRTLEKTHYSESEIARKLQKCVAVREQRAVDALAKLMPDEAFKAFLTLMEEESAKKLEPGNPLLDWYNSGLDGNPEFLKPWCDQFLKTKAWGAHRIFLAKCFDYCEQKFKEIMGEEVYHIFYDKLPLFLPGMFEDREAPYDYPIAKSSFLYQCLETVNSWLESLSDDQRQQLYKGEVRNFSHMDWLKCVTSLFRTKKEEL